MILDLVDLTPFFPLSTSVERGTGGEVFKDVNPIKLLNWRRPLFFSCSFKFLFLNFYLTDVILSLLMKIEVV
jgi:hypothetical protein